MGYNYKKDVGVKTCSYVNCARKICPNNTPVLKKDSRPFPSCMYSLAYKEKYGETNDSNDNG